MLVCFSHSYICHSLSVKNSVDMISHSFLEAITVPDRGNGGVAGPGTLVGGAVGGGVPMARRYLGPFQNIILITNKNKQHIPMAHVDR